MSQWNEPPEGPHGASSWDRSTIPHSPIPNSPIQQRPGTQVLEGPDTRTRVSPWAVVTFAAVVLAVAVAALVLVLTSGDPKAKETAAKGGTETTVPVTSVPTTAPNPTTTAVTTVPTTTAPPTTVPTVTVTVPPAPVQQVISEPDAHQRLLQQIADDAPQVEALVGAWIPQISSKKPGIDVPNDDRGVYNYAMVLADHLAYRQRYAGQGGALLLWSGNFNFKEGDWFVSVVPITFPTADGANAWCDAQNIGPDDCFAKRLDHSGSSVGSVKLRS